MRLFHLLMITLLPVPMCSQPVKCQSSFRWTICCVRRWNSLFSSSQRATQQETQRLLASSRISSSSLLGRPDGMGCIKKASDNTTVCSWSLKPAKLNNYFSWVARQSLPPAPPSGALSQDMLRCWQRAAREQTVMCNQAAGPSRCLTRV